MEYHTVYNDLSKLESADILHRCSRFDVRGKEILKTQEKFYLADPALRYRAALKSISFRRNSGPDRLTLGVPFRYLVVNLVVSIAKPKEYLKVEAYGGNK